MGRSDRGWGDDENEKMLKHFFFIILLPLVTSHSPLSISLSIALHSLTQHSDAPPLKRHPTQWCSYTKNKGLS